MHADGWRVGVGNVYEANEGLPLEGATVANDSGYSTLTAATEDPNVDDGFYILFAENALIADLHQFTASFMNFSPEVEMVDWLPAERLDKTFTWPPDTWSLTHSTCMRTC